MSILRKVLAWIILSPLFMLALPFFMIWGLGSLFLWAANEVDLAKKLCGRL